MSESPWISEARAERQPRCGPTLLNQTHERVAFSRARVICQTTISFASSRLTSSRWVELAPSRWSASAPSTEFANFGSLMIERHSRADPMSSALVADHLQRRHVLQTCLHEPEGLRSKGAGDRRRSGSVHSSRASESVSIPANCLSRPGSYLLWRATSARREYREAPHRKRSAAPPTHRSRRPEAPQRKPAQTGKRSYPPSA